MLHTLASLATCSVADCERQHGHHKRICGPRTSFVSLMVNSVNDQARLTYIKEQKSSQSRFEKLGCGVKRKAITAEKGRAKPMKAGSLLKFGALHAFRKRFIATQKFEGQKPNKDWCSRESWGEVKQVFLALSPDEKQKWKIAAQSANSKSKSKRLGSGFSKWTLVSAEGVGDVDLVSSKAHALRPPTILNAAFSTSESQTLKAHCASVGDFVRHLQAWA